MLQNNFKKWIANVRTCLLYKAIRLKKCHLKKICNKEINIIDMIKERIVNKMIKAIQNIM